MEKYALIARSSKYPDINVKIIDANNDIEAIKAGEVWIKESMGFRYRLTVAKAIYDDFNK